MSRLLIRVLIAPRGNRPKLKFRTRLLLLHGARQDEARVSRANGRVLKWLSLGTALYIAQ